MQDVQTYDEGFSERGRHTGGLERWGLLAAGGARGTRVHESVRIERTVDELYRFWRRLENLPRFMRNLEQVVDRGDGRSHWVRSHPHHAPG